MTDPVVLSEAAAYTPQPPEPHQKDAWDWVEALLTPAELMEFTELYRAAPEAPAGNPVVAYTPSTPFNSWVTPHIQAGEVAIWDEARRFKQQHQCTTCLEILHFLEEVRAYFGGHPIVITSGYRPPHINQAVGGASDSEHLFNVPEKGAIDFCIEKVSIYDVERYVDDHWPFSVGYGASRGFVHVGIRPGRPRLRWSY